MEKFFDEDFFKLMRSLVITGREPLEEIKMSRTETGISRIKTLKMKTEEYNKIFSDPGKATRQRLVAREVQCIYATGGENSLLLRSFFVFFSETLAPIPMSL